jgi:hypothetical protein
MHQGRIARCLRTMMAFLLPLLVPGPASAGSPSSPEEASLRSEWEKVRANQERTIMDNQKRIAEIYAREGRAEEYRHAEKITRDRVSAANASLKSGGKGQQLAQTAEIAGRDARALAELYKAQAEYLDGATGEWADGAERKKLKEAASLIQRNAERTESLLAKATEAADTIATQLGQSGVLEKVAQIETAAKEAGERLSARWELEHAARVREREQREREAGERAREQRR